ncbi:hypothetical protein ACSFA2_06020 [Variovorax sp. LT2P21]
MTQGKRISADIRSDVWQATRRFRRVPGLFALCGIGVRLQPPEGR